MNLSSRTQYDIDLSTSMDACCFAGPWGEWCRETAVRYHIPMAVRLSNTYSLVCTHYFTHVESYFSFFFLLLLLPLLIFFQNTWRSSGDINVQSWHTNLESLIGRGSYSLPGGWNYPDSLEVGNGKRGKIMPESEARAHFSLWCITSSPLYLGTKLQNLSESDLAIVSNKDAINVNQAWAGFAGDMLNYSSPNVLPSNISKSNYSRLPENSVWWKPLPNASAAAVMYVLFCPACIKRFCCTGLFLYL